MHETDEIYCFCHLSCKYNNYPIIKLELYCFFKEPHESPKQRFHRKIKT